jgi:hypothetical protein
MPSSTYVCVFCHRFDGEFMAVADHEKTCEQNPNRTHPDTDSQSPHSSYAAEDASTSKTRRPRVLTKKKPDVEALKREIEAAFKVGTIVLTEYDNDDIDKSDLVYANEDNECLCKITAFTVEVEDRTVYDDDHGDEDDFDMHILVQLNVEALTLPGREIRIVMITVTTDDQYSGVDLDGVDILDFVRKKQNWINDDDSCSLYWAQGDTDIISELKESIDRIDGLVQSITGE